MSDVITQKKKEKGTKKKKIKKKKTKRKFIMVNERADELEFCICLNSESGFFCSIEGKVSSKGALNTSAT